MKPLQKLLTIAAMFSTDDKAYKRDGRELKVSPERKDESTCPHINTCFFYDEEFSVCNGNNRYKLCGYYKDYIDSHNGRQLKNDTG